MVTLKASTTNETRVCLTCRTGLRVPKHQSATRRCVCGSEYQDIGDVRIPRKRDRRGWAIITEAVRQRFHLGGSTSGYLRNKGREFGIALGYLDSPQAVRDYAAVRHMLASERRAGVRAAQKGNMQGASRAEHERLKAQELKNDRLRQRLAPT